jgi:RHS repeat-associated protein
MTVVGQPQVVYTYDNANRLTQIQQGTSTVTIGYDDADRRTSVTYPNTNSVTYAYNAASELTSLTYKQGATTLGDLMYTYDAAGNRTKTGGTFARSNIPPALTTTSYNANNQQLTLGTTTETFDLNGNLATSTDAGVTTTYAWNARNQLTGISGPGLTASFTYDSFGRRTGKTINGTTTNFVYDGLNPVQEKSGATVTANLLTGLGIDEFFTRTDGVGVRALLPDALGSTVALGDGTGTLQTQYTYEPFGFTTQTGATTDAGVTTTYTWNARNQLTGISRTGLTASFTYDSFGRRTGRTVNGVVTNYVYDGLNPVQEKNGATVTANLLTGLGIDEFFTRTDGAGVRALLLDVLGSTVALGDGTGVLLTQYTYEPYGFTTQTGSASTSSYKYTGREDDGSGLFYYRARYYHPRLQRFATEDPLGFRGGDVNFYGYAQGDPISLVDPLGLMTDSVTEAIKQAAARGNVQELEALLDATGNQAAKAAIDRLRSKATDVIAKECKGSINQEFPSEMYKKTLEEIMDLARSGNPVAQKAKKLLTDQRFKK